MDLGVGAATFGLVFAAELPDKTFIATVVLAARHRSPAVWFGAAAGLIAQAALAVGAGRLIRLLPHTAVEAVVTGLFFAGAAYLLFVPERHQKEQADKIADAELGVERKLARSLRVGLGAFVVITLAEFGDLTQVVIANLSARFGDGWSVFLGASAAFLVISGVAVVLGQTIERRVPIVTIRRLSAAVLAGLGTWSLVSLVR